MAREIPSPLLEKLDAADIWLRSELHLDGPDWIRNGITCVREVKAASRAGLLSGYFGGPDRAEKILRFIEAVEFAEASPFIMRSYAQRRRLVRGMIRTIVAGPQTIAGESPDDNSNAARNAMFEFVLGARFDALGHRVELQEPDLRVELNDKLTMVACKRPFGPGSIRRNIDDAAVQLANSLKQGPNGAVGLIAISATRSVDLSGLGAPVDLRAAMEALAGRLRDLAQAHIPVLNAVEDNRVVAALFHLSAPAIAEADGLTPAQLIVEHTIPGRGHKDGDLLRLMGADRY